jgi:hypothetical protein
VHKERELELKAYEQLARCEYYLSHVKKAGYYLDRFVRGRMETLDSKTRSIYVLQYKQAKARKEKDIQAGIIPQPIVNEPNYRNVESNVLKIFD